MLKCPVVTHQRGLIWHQISDRKSVNHTTEMILWSMILLSPRPSLGYIAQCPPYGWLKQVLWPRWSKTNFRLQNWASVICQPHNWYPTRHGSHAYHWPPRASRGHFWGQITIFGPRRVKTHFRFHIWPSVNPHPHIRYPTRCGSHVYFWPPMASGGHFGGQITIFGPRRVKTHFWLHIWSSVNPHPHIRYPTQGGFKNFGLPWPLEAI